MRARQRGWSGESDLVEFEQIVGGADEPPFTAHCVETAP